MYISAAPTLSGFAGTAVISVSGGQYRVNGGTWTTATGTVAAGQTVQVQTQASTSPGASQTATMTIGNVSATFEVITAAAADTTPDAISPFPSVSGSSNEPEAYFGYEYRKITGITTPITLRIERLDYVGDADVAELVAVRSPDAQAWTNLPADARPSG